MTKHAMIYEFERKFDEGSYDHPDFIDEQQLWVEAWKVAIAHAVPRWIPVSERLPEQEFYENGEELVYAARYGDGSYDLMNLSAIEGNQHAITHWFPIAAPVEAQGEKEL